jgi:hypothetical protein
METAYPVHVHVLYISESFVYFRVDKDKSGQISANELSSALSNGKWLDAQPLSKCNIHCS